MVNAFAAALLSDKLVLQGRRAGRRLLPVLNMGIPRTQRGLHRSLPAPALSRPSACSPATSSTPSLATHLPPASGSCPPRRPGGWIRPAHEAVFPNAELVLHAADASCWSDDKVLAQADNDQDKQFRSLLARVHAGGLPRPAPATTTCRAGHRCMAAKKRSPAASPRCRGARPHCQAMYLPGWLVASDTGSLLIWGDVMQCICPSIQFFSRHPEATAHGDFRRRWRSGRFTTPRNTPARSWTWRSD